MKNCKKCGAEIAKSAKVCPKCGARFGLPGFVKALIIIFVILACIIGCVASCTKGVGDAIDEAFSGYDDVNGKTSFKVGETFESKYIKVTLNSSNLNFTGYSEYADLKDGYKVVEFKFTAENIGEESQTFDYTDFDCYADGEAMQQFYSTKESGLDTGGTISKGKKVSANVYCEVPKDAKKVSVEYDPTLADKDYEFVAS